MSAIQLALNMLRTALKSAESERDLFLEEVEKRNFEIKRLQEAIEFLEVPLNEARVEVQVEKEDKSVEIVEETVEDKEEENAVEEEVVEDEEECVVVEEKPRAPLTNNTILKLVDNSEEIIQKILRGDVASKNKLVSWTSGKYSPKSREMSRILKALKVQPKSAVYLASELYIPQMQIMRYVQNLNEQGLLA